MPAMDAKILGIVQKLAGFVQNVRELSIIYTSRGGWSDSKNAVNTFLLRIPAVQESPAQTSLFGRSQAAKVPLGFRSGSPL
ncbi:MAG: hypothetical protein AXA67_07650 [Methylothermaceae bacteria B42]|nr:MAG: hypothetical protein AXA67_07650 [Methylothermaceae bacteria B42]